MKYYIYFFILITAFFQSCKDEDGSKGYPGVTTFTNLIVTDEGVVVNAEIQDAGIYEILDYGFVYALAGVEIEEYFNRISLGSVPVSGAFTALIERNLISGKSYVVKAYVKTKNKTVYGNAVTFVSRGSKPPLIKSYSPEGAYFGDTLTISGAYFSDKNSENQVIFGNIHAKVIVSTDTLLKVIVPQFSESSSVPLLVSVAEKTSTSDKIFTLGLPTINSFSPEKVFPLEMVKIRGKGLSNVKMVTIEGLPSYISEVTDSTIEFILPDMKKGKKTLQFSQMDRIVTVGKQLEVISTEIHSVSPLSVSPDQEITVRGNYLNRTNEYYIGYNLTNVTFLSDSLVRLKTTEPFCSGKILAKYNYNTIAVSEQVVKMRAPVITSVSPSSVTYGDVIQFKGDYFSREIMQSSLGIFSYVSKNEAQLVIPWTLDAGDYTVDLNICDDSYIMNNAKFTIPEIEITEVLPHEIKRGSVITIKVKNLPTKYSYEYMKCKLDGKNILITDMSNGLIVALVDPKIKCSENPTLTLTVGPQEKSVSGYLHFNEPWEEINFSGSSNLSSVYNFSNGVAYVLSVGETGSNLKKFDSSIEGWVYMTSLAKSNFVNFGFNRGSDLFFIGTGSDLVGIIYKYSLTNEKFEKLKNLPVQLTNQSFGFAIDGKVYMGTLNGFYQFDESKNDWVKRSSLPTRWSKIENPIVFTANNKGFVGFNTRLVTVYGGADDEQTEFWSYDPKTDSWTDLGLLPFSVIYAGSAATEYNGKVYMAGRSYESGNKFGEYNPLTNTFKEMILPPESMTSNSFLFVQDNYLHFTSDGDYEVKWMYKLPVSELQNIYR